MHLFDQQVLSYHFTIHPEIRLPKHVAWLNPYGEQEAIRCMELFYQKYFHDRHERTYILGINPGRFGAGLTGIPFTDPIRLEALGIDNAFQKKPELSSVFIYDMIDACGGPIDFYSKYYITSLSPLGLIKDGINFNYYDDPALARVIQPFIVRNIETQLSFGANRDIAYILGQGQNFNYLQKLNASHGWWNRVVPLPHPRWIMQYRLKQKQEFVTLYKETLFT